MICRGGLKGRIPGLKEIFVRTSCLESSNADVMLDTTFVDADSLREYAGHPEHNAVADSRVRPYTQVRLCMDYEVE